MPRRFHNEVFMQQVQPILQLDHAVRQLICVIHENNRIARASLTQFYTLNDLEKRWGLGRNTVLTTLRQVVGYCGQTGKAIRISLNDVLKVDEFLERQYNVRKASVRMSNSNH